MSEKLKATKTLLVLTYATDSIPEAMIIVMSISSYLIQLCRLTVDTSDIEIHQQITMEVLLGGFITDEER